MIYNVLEEALVTKTRGAADTELGYLPALLDSSIAR